MKKLLKLLYENASLTPAEIAVMIGEKEEAVKEQINELERTGIIKGYKALVNWDKIPGAGLTASIELKVTPQKETGFDDVAKRIMQFEEVDSVYLMAGSYDLAVMVKGMTLQDISMFVSRKLATIDEIVSTSTHFLLKKYKEWGVDMINDEEEDKRSMVL